MRLTLGPTSGTTDLDDQQSEVKPVHQPPKRKLQAASAQIVTAAEHKSLSTKTAEEASEASYVSRHKSQVTVNKQLSEKSFHMGLKKPKRPLMSPVSPWQWEGCA